MEKKQQLMELWKTCFNDSDDFIQLFFDRVYKPENVLFIEEDGQIVSALHIIPYTMSYYCCSVLSVSYIAGAATLPEKRGKGLMGQLIEMALKQMRKQKVDVTALIPANKSLFSYYKRFGYTTIFDYEEDFFLDLNLGCRAKFITLGPEPSDSIYNYFDEMLKMQPACILHTKEDLGTIIRDIHLSNGGVIAALDEMNEPIGLAFYIPEKDTIMVKEILYDDTPVREALFQEIERRTGCYFNVRYKLPSYYKEETTALGMAMILNKKKVRDLWFRANPSQETEEQLKKLKQMNISTFTRLAFNYSNKMAHMSLMLD